METISEINQFDYHRLRGKHLSIAQSKLPDMEAYLDEIWKVGAVDELGNDWFNEQRLKKQIRIFELKHLISQEKLNRETMAWHAKLVAKGELFGFRTPELWKAWYRLQWKHSLDDQKEYERELKRIEYIPKNEKVDLERVKAYPITDLINVNKAAFALCPFHGEKSPSMKIYKDNHFHCFGCDKTGDVITLAQELWNTDFITTIKRLS